MKKILAFCFSLVLTFVFCLPVLTWATSVDCNVPANFANEECKATGLLKSAAGSGGAGYQTSTSLSSLVGSIIKALLTLLGVIFLVLTVYAGYLWMTARGEEKNVEDAKSVLKNALIGLVLSLAAYAVTNYIVGRLVTATQAS